jgi:glycosyltransferase involved in cell wall biosynthesis
MHPTTPATPSHPISHINLAAGFRGGERQTELLIRELAARRWPQRLVARAGGVLAERCRDIPGLQIRAVIPNPLTAASAARGASLVHAHEARAVYSGWLLHRLQKIPYILTRRIDYPLRETWARTRAYRTANRVIAISQSVARSVESHYPDIRCRVVPDAHAGMAVRRPESSDIRRRYTGKIVIGHLGELDHSHKGQRTIVEAARQMRHTNPGAHFLLLGTGKDEREFRAAAAGLDNIEFAGFVENVADYLAAFDLFVYPSLREGLGSSLLDALSFGLPIVATEVGGIPEIVEHEVNGLLIAPEQPAELVAALQRLLGDAELRASMGRNNRQKATLYDASHMATSYESIYREILNG